MSSLRFSENKSVRIACFSNTSLRYSGSINKKGLDRLVQVIKCLDRLVQVIEGLDRLVQVIESLDRLVQEIKGLDASFR